MSAQVRRGRRVGEGKGVGVTTRSGLDGDNGERRRRRQETGV